MTEAELLTELRAELRAELRTAADNVLASRNLPKLRPCDIVVLDAAADETAKTFAGVEYLLSDFFGRLPPVGEPAAVPKAAPMTAADCSDVRELLIKTKKFLKGNGYGAFSAEQLSTALQSMSTNGGTRHKTRRTLRAALAARGSLTAGISGLSGFNHLTYEAQLDVFHVAIESLGVKP